MKHFGASVAGAWYRDASGKSLRIQNGQRLGGWEQLRAGAPQTLKNIPKRWACCFPRTALGVKQISAHEQNHTG